MPSSLETEDSHSNQEVNVETPNVPQARSIASNIEITNQMPDFSTGTSEVSIKNIPADPKKYFPWLCREIHGRCILPTGYELCRVPADAIFENDCAEDLPWWKPKGLVSTNTPERVIGSSSSFVKVGASLVQLLFGISTLYRTRGHQVMQFGYAAYGLTVLPYAWMSFINLIANVVQPNYPALYVVESKLLSRVRSENPQTCTVEGTVGRITVDSGKTALENNGALRC